MLIMVTKHHGIYFVKKLNHENTSLQLQYAYRIQLLR